METRLKGWCIIRLDHIAFRVASRDKTVKFLEEAFGYKFQAEFEIYFDDEKKEKALCIALEPPEKRKVEMPFVVSHIGFYGEAEYHMAPEIFVSEGTPGSIVHNWVQARGGIGGIHHFAYNVPSVEEKRKEWLEKGWGDFTSEKAFKCDDLTQIFSKPHALTGIIYEFIERKGHGFCQANVKELMNSTKDLGVKIDADKNMK